MAGCGSDLVPGRFELVNSGEADVSSCAEEEKNLMRGHSTRFQMAEENEECGWLIVFVFVADLYRGAEHE